MNQKNNLNQFLECKKDPYLRFRYSRGIGDIIACILHSKCIGWLTKLITGKQKPCNTCSQRSNALNILFPIPLWKIFFKNAEIMTKSLQLDLQNCGYEVSLTNDKLGLSSFKAKSKIKEETETKIPENNDLDNTNQYNLITSGENILGEFLIRTEIYKRK